MDEPVRDDMIAELSHGYSRRVSPVQPLFMGRGPDRIETLTTALGEAKNRADELGKRLLAEFRVIDGVVQQLKKEGLKIEVRFDDEALHACYMRKHAAPFWDRP